MVANPNKSVSEDELLAIWADIYSDDIGKSPD
jgi:hypothetical protein